MRKMLVCALALMAGGVFAVGVEQVDSKPVLVGYAELAPFNDIMHRAGQVGKMVGNPFAVPMLTGMSQVAMSSKVGPFRLDAPFACCVYVRLREWTRAASQGDQGTATNLWDAVLVYPCRDSAAEMKMRHAGATLEPDGTLRLRKGGLFPSGTWVKFSADGAFCAFARSADMAALGLRDFAASRTKAEAKRPLARFDLTASGMDALSALFDSPDAVDKGTGIAALLPSEPELGRKLEAFQIRQRAMQRALLARIAGFRLTLDVDEAGFTCDATVLSKPGAPLPKVAGLGLPADALASVPPDAPIFGGQYNLLGDADEKDFRACLALVADLADWGCGKAQNAESCRKYMPLLKECAGALADVAREAPYPSVADWSVASLAFDAAHHPWLGFDVECARTKEVGELMARTWRRLIAALDRQWPGSKMVEERLPAEMVVDLGAVIDVVAAETGTGKDEPSIKAIQNAKKNVASFFGDTKIRRTGKNAGTRTSGSLAGRGVAPRAGASNAETRLAAVLPEVAAERPAGVFYLSLYALLRDEVLPIVEKYAGAKTWAKIGKYEAVLPAARPNGAVAGAVWSRKDGVRRLLVRVTADEVGSFAAAVNACKAVDRAEKK